LAGFKALRECHKPIVLAFNGVTAGNLSDFPIASEGTFGGKDQVCGGSLKVRTSFFYAKFSKLFFCMPQPRRPGRLVGVGKSLALRAWRPVGLIRTQKKFSFFRQKTHFGGRKLQDDPKAQADTSP
jgi:hypothetical protein